MALPAVRLVEPCGDYRLRIIFSDGLEAVLDWQERLAKARRGGIMDELKEPRFFAQVMVWPEARTIRWPNDADICPDVLYEWAKRVAASG